MNLAAAEPPAVQVGDLRTDLPGLAAEAPTDATLVVFHTAVLAYLHDPADRATFLTAITALRNQRRIVWPANETPTHIPSLDPAAREPHPPGDFPLCRDAAPRARTDPHGTHITWTA